MTLPDVVTRCRARFGPGPCIRIPHRDGEEEAAECTGWCPLLKEVITWEGELREREAEIVEVDEL